MIKFNTWLLWWDFESFEIMNFVGQHRSGKLMKIIGNKLNNFFKKMLNFVNFISDNICDFMSMATMLIYI